MHNAALRAQPALVENEKKLLEKINILCLMEIIFRFSICLLFFFFFFVLPLICARRIRFFPIQFVQLIVGLNRYMLPCSRSSDDRTIPLSIIAERTKLSIEEVEHLLMKSLSVSPHVLEILMKSN